MANFKTKSDLVKMIPPTFKGDYWCSGQEGFGIRIGAKKKDGTYQKEYLARYKDEVGKEHRQQLGRFGEIAFHDAAIKAATILADVRKRKQNVKRGITNVPMLKEGYEQMIAGRRGGWESVTTLEGYDSRFKNLERFYDQPLDEISTKDWLELYEYNVKHHGPAAANAAHSLGSIIYGFFAEPIDVEKGKPQPFRSTFNPCANLSKNAIRHGKHIPKPKEKDNSVPAELWPDYFNFLFTRAGGQQRDYILWGLFTGFRHSLLASLRWSRIDWKAHTYFISKEDIGNKAKKDFNFPIPNYLWEKVVLPRHEVRDPRCDWIIESPRWPGTPLVSVRGTYEALKKKIGIKNTDHDLRRHIASVAHDAGCQVLSIQRLLAHSVAPKNRDTAVTERYIKASMRNFRKTVEKTSEYYQLLMRRDSGLTGKLGAYIFDEDDNFDDDEEVQPETEEAVPA